MKYIRILFLAIPPVLLACNATKVLDTESADGFQIGNYKTFDFFKLEARGDTSDNFETNAASMKDAITRNLESRGLRRVDANADMLVNIGIVVTEKTQTRETTFREAPRYMGQRRYSWKSEEIEIGTYKSGTATIHLVDANTKEMVWRGVAEGIIPKNDEKLSKAIESGVDELFERL